MLKSNLGSADKIARIILGLALMSLLIFMSKTTLVYIAAVIGLVLVSTAVINFCPLYGIFGIKTNK